MWPKPSRSTVGLGLKCSLFLAFLQLACRPSIECNADVNKDAFNPDLDRTADITQQKTCQLGNKLTIVIVKRRWYVFAWKSVCAVTYN